MSEKKFTVAVLAVVCSFALQAHALDGVSVEAGRGKGANVRRVGAQWKWQKKWLETGNWHVGGYWDAQLGQWSGSGKNTITDIGLTPVFRLQQSAPSGLSPYAEAAIGFHLISNTRLDANRAFGSAFQFGDHIGAGVRFGERGRYDLGIRLQHVSNGGIKKPNNGINFALVRFQYSFD